MYKSTDGGISFKVVVVNIDNIEKIIISNKNIMYLGPRQGLYKSNDGTNFHKINDLGNDWVFTLAISTNEVIYVGYKKGLYALTDNSNIFNKITDLNAYYITFTKKSTIFTNCSGEVVDGLYQIDLIDNLLTLKQLDYLGNKYRGLLYKQAEKIDIKAQYLKTATLDGKDITVPITNLELKAGDAGDGSYINGEHTLILTLKNEYQQYLAAFNANPNTGQVTYKLWVKTAINKNKINYTTNVDDTDLFIGLISNKGNTSNCPIIKIKNKDWTTNNLALKITITSNWINFKESYYVLGSVAESKNYFLAVSTPKKVTKNFIINGKGIYHFHLTDIINNSYDSYLELGAENWKLRGILKT